MLLVGLVLLNLAGLLHCFYAANARMEFGQQAGAFIRWGKGIVALAILVLLAAVGFIWVGSSIPAVLAALLVYFFVFPLIFVPLLQRIYPPAQPGESYLDMEEREMEMAKAIKLNEPVIDVARPQDFWRELDYLLREATENHQPFVDIDAGQLHRRVGGYPDPKKHRMPICCRVMREEMQEGDVVLGEPPKGAGASLTIRYHLPRLTAENEG
jgi:hypothetical protein